MESCSILLISALSRYTLSHVTHAFRGSVGPRSSPSCFNVKEYKLIDSFKFMASSLDSLIKNIPGTERIMLDSITDALFLVERSRAWRAKLVPPCDVECLHLPSAYSLTHSGWGWGGKQKETRWRE